MMVGGWGIDLGAAIGAAAVGAIKTALKFIRAGRPRLLSRNRHFSVQLPKTTHVFSLDVPALLCESRHQQLGHSAVPQSSLKTSRRFRWRGRSSGNPTLLRFSRARVRPFRVLDDERLDGAHMLLDVDGGLR